MQGFDLTKMNERLPKLKYLAVQDVDDYRIFSALKNLKVTFQ